MESSSSSLFEAGRRHRTYVTCTSIVALLFYIPGTAVVVSCSAAPIITVLECFPQRGLFIYVRLSGRTRSAQLFLGNKVMRIYCEGIITYTELYREG